MDELKKIEKDKAIKREIAKLKRNFKNIDPDKKIAVDGLIAEAAFMKVILEEVKEMINKDGVVEMFEQGKQKSLREHPATKVYSTMISRYTVIYKQLMELQSAGDDKGKKDELYDFLYKAN